MKIVSVILRVHATILLAPDDKWKYSIKKNTSIKDLCIDRAKNPAFPYPGQKDIFTGSLLYKLVSLLKAGILNKLVSLSQGRRVTLALAQAYGSSSLWHNL